ncbi:MAG: hypothetical protein GTN71_18260, partial [Anaerolineae bacterium]|nr:hypothetical protein [Anaerolineae bacterium]
IPSKLASSLTVRAAGNSTILGRATTVSFEAAVETVSDSLAGPAGLDFAEGFPVAPALLAPFLTGLAAPLVAFPAPLGSLPGLAVEVPLCLACVVLGVDGLVPAFLAVVWVVGLPFDASAELLVFFLRAVFGLAACLLLTVFVTD